MKNNKSLLIVAFFLFIWTDANPTLSLLTPIKGQALEDRAEASHVTQPTLQTEENLDPKPINLFFVIHLDRFHRILHDWASGLLASDDIEADLNIAILNLASFTGMTDNASRTTRLQSWLGYSCDDFLSVSRSWHQGLLKNISSGYTLINNYKYTKIIELRANGEWDIPFVLPNNFSEIKISRPTKLLDNTLGRVFSSVHNICVPYVRSTQGQFVLTVPPQDYERVSSCLHCIYVLLSSVHQKPPLSKALVEVYQAFDPRNEQETLQRWGKAWMEEEKRIFFNEQRTLDNPGI